MEFQNQLDESFRRSETNLRIIAHPEYRNTACKAKATENAIKLFQSQPGFVESQLWLRDRMEEAAPGESAESIDFGTRARAELALKWFELRAEAFVRMVGTIETQNAIIAMFYQIERVAWLDFMGAPPEYVRAVSEAARWLAGELAKSRGRWIRRGYEKIATPQERLHIVSSADDLFNRSAAEWEDIEISFLGYDTVRIQIGQAFRNRNYAELGFEDRRSEKPNRAWRVLMALAEPRSDTKCIGRTEMTWPQEERRFQEIRKVFRKYFGLDGDPLPYVRGSGYRVRFRIRCAESFR